LNKWDSIKIAIPAFASGMKRNPIFKKPALAQIGEAVKPIDPNPIQLLIKVREPFEKLNRSSEIVTRALAAQPRPGRVFHHHKSTNGAKLAGLQVPVNKNLNFF
jgi:hypothetical protein